MTPYLAEFIGTAVLILLGDGVVANVLLEKSKGQNGGWIVITLGWGLAVFTGVFISASISGAHINPAVTLSLAMAGAFSWGLVPGYMLAQFLGAAAGAFLVWLHYRPHFDITDDAGAKLGIFCTVPAIRNAPANFIAEVIGTFLLVLGVFYISGARVNGEDATLGSLDALPVALLVTAIGLSLGGPTGYAINPARDFSPRLMHALLPIRGKGSSDWGYSWIPVLGPVAGGALAALVFGMLGKG